MDLSLSIFVGIGLFGALLIVLSFVMGEVGHLGDLGEAGVEHDFGAAEAGEGADGGDLGGDDAPGPLSMRVLSVFLSAFGLVGAACRASGLQTSTSAALGVASGWALGWCMWKFMCFLWAQGGSSEVRLRELEGCLAEVTVAIPAQGPGQVACVLDDTRTHQIARSESGVEIPAGTTVRITQVSPECVLVEPLAPDARPVSEGLRRTHHA